MGSCPDTVPLRTRRAESLYKVYDESILLILNGTSLDSVSGSQPNISYIPSNVSDHRLCSIKKCNN